MNARESVTHEQAAELLPWLVNETLGDDEKEGVLKHAHACVICRRDLDELEQLRDSIAHSKAAIPAADMRNINARIDALIDNRNWRRALISRVRGTIASPWRIAFVAQSALVIVLASLLLWPATDERVFTVLTDEPTDLPTGSYVRVVFNPELASSEVPIFLDRFELRVVNGPSRHGVYTLGLARTTSVQDRDKLVLLLQDDSRVLFAQPVGGRAEQ